MLKITSYKNNTNAGTYTTTITGLGAYAGKSQELTWTITPIEVTNAKINLKATSATYTGKAITPVVESVTAGSEDLTQFVDVKTPSITDAGSVNVTATFNDVNHVGTIPAVKFTVNKAAMSKVTVTLSATKYTYNGKAKKPTIKKATFNGKDVTSMLKITSYKNNTNAGTATANVVATKNFSGDKKVSFKILKAANTLKASAKSPKVSAKKTEKAAQTIAKKNAFTVSGAKGAVSFAKVKGSKKLAVKSNGNVVVSKGTKAGTYSVVVKVSAKGNKNYKAGSQSVTLKVTVK
jgi:hypothetical protein